MKKVLMTGFDPFEKELLNPSFEAVKLVPSRIADIEIVKVEIPTSFYDAKTALYKAIKENSPDVVICVGQAGGRYDFTPERVAVNIIDARIPDNNGVQPVDETIESDGKSAYFSSLPIKMIVQEVKKAGIPSSVSNTAGTFVCNYIMYVLLHLIETEFKNVRGGFIHVPYITSQIINKKETPSLSLTDIAKALEIAAKISAENTIDAKLVGGSTH